MNGSSPLSETDQRGQTARPGAPPHSSSPRPDRTMAAMPEVEFDVHWPDGRSEWVYSPSLVVEDVFVAGHRYPVDEFVALSRQAMRAASDRVQARWGFPCSRAAATLATIETRAAGFPDGQVVVASFRRR